MKKILLITPIDREFFLLSVFPLGLGYISSILNKNGYHVKILDMNVDRNFNELHKILNENNFDYIGISSIITQYKKVKEIVKIIRSHNSFIKIILGGAGPSSHPYLYFNNIPIDIICINEGEKTILNLLHILEKNNDLSQCKGIAYKTNDKIIITPPQDFISNIDSIPFPDWNLFDNFQYYIDNFLFKFDQKNGINIMTSRGCVGRCTYCFRNCGNKIRYRSPENISDEIRFLKEKYKIEHFHFIDDTFISKDIKRFYSLLSLIKKEEITWSCNSRVNFITYPILQKMKDSGCINIAYGIESGSQKILNEMKKGVKVEQSANALKLTRKAGIDHKGYFIIGYPSETKDTVKETVSFCKENLVGGEFFFATPLPSTPLYDYVIENKLIKNEDLYIETIGEVRNFVINLTKMDNETLFTIKENAEKEIQNHLKSHGIDIRVGVRENPRESVKHLPKFN